MTCTGPERPDVCRSSGNAQDGLADRTEGDVLLDAAEQREMR
jgi:hypothetical protein